MGNLWVYGSFAAIVGLGSAPAPGESLQPAGCQPVGIRSLFAITNFGVWLADPNTPTTTAGLLAAYGAGFLLLEYPLVTCLRWRTLRHLRVKLNGAFRHWQ